MTRIRHLILVLAGLTLLAIPAGALESPHGPLELACDLCHSTDGWILKSEPLFRHDVDTTWPLEGEHGRMACTSCHTQLRFKGTGAACIDCHLDPHQSGLGEQCRDCHTPERWVDSALFLRRHALSPFPLTGAHGTLSCDRCHTGTGPSQFAATTGECSACHLDTWHNTTRPPHELSDLGQACQTCHNTSRWNDATGFNHEMFPLTGAHAVISCAACHVGGIFQGTSSQCYSCHQIDYVEGPLHVDNNYPLTCADCHSTSAWRPSTVDHSRTAFPLLGAHVTTACGSCHVNGVFAGTPSDCWSCHQADYNGALNPDHAGGQYPQTCAVCHSSTAWSPADFNHGLTDFPLTGAHVTVSCAACHTSGQYTGTSSECQSCHLTDYQATTDPDHVAAAFPLACASCHSTSTWEGATFNHDQQFFPINSGSHRGEWTSCQDCHVTAGNYSDFSCLGCHEHSQSAMNGEHDEVGGYSYNSQACLQCHPAGEANDRFQPRTKLRIMDTRPGHFLR